MTATFRIPGRFASTVYAVLLIIAIVLVSFGFPLVLIGMVFMFEGLSYHPSSTGVLCVVMGLAGVAFGMLICRYTHKRALRVPQNKIGVAPKTRTELKENVSSLDTQTDAEERQDIHHHTVNMFDDSKPTSSISWSELGSIESRDSAYGGYFRPVVPAAKSRVFAIHPSITSREFVLDGAALLRPPKAPDNYNVPPMSATPPILYKIEKDCNISLKEKSIDSATP